MFRVRVFVFPVTLSASNAIRNIIFNSGQQPRIPSFNKHLWDAIAPVFNAKGLEIKHTGLSLSFCQLLCA
jgi:hypothetical protein